MALSGGEESLACILPRGRKAGFSAHARDLISDGYSVKASKGMGGDGGVAKGRGKHRRRVEKEAVVRDEGARG